LVKRLINVDDYEDGDNDDDLM